MQLGLVDQLPQLFSQLAMAAAGGFGSHLHGDRIEARVVAIRVAPDQRFDLCSISHDILEEQLPKELQPSTIAAPELP